MEQKKEEQERTRKVYAPNGERSQKAFTFRLDLENAAWLEKQVNKGRYINGLIAKDKAEHE